MGGILVEPKVNFNPSAADNFATQISIGKHAENIGGSPLVVSVTGSGQLGLNRATALRTGLFLPQSAAVRRIRTISVM